MRGGILVIFCQLGIEIGSDTVERIKKGNMK